MKLSRKIVLAGALLSSLYAFHAKAADSTVAGMTAGAAISGTDLFYCSQAVGTNDRKCTGTQILTWVQAGWGSGVATWTATPSSANLAAALTDETGTGSLVFANTPTLVTPVLGVATATSINKVALTAPATGSTLTVADGKTLTANNTLTLAGTDGTTLTGPGSSTTLAGLSIANSFTTSQNVTPSSDVISLALRRNGAAQTSNILEIQTEANAFLAGFSKTGALTIESAAPQVTLGVNATTLGSIKLFGNTSGDLTLQPTAAAGTASVATFPARSGTVGYTSGALTSGNCAKFDASGNIVDNGAVCGGGGGLTIDTTAITSGTAGRVLFESATNKVSEDSGLTFDATNNALTVGGATVTTSNPVLNLTQTFNDGVVTFTGVKLNITDTASAAASMLMDLQTGGTSQFKVTKAGDVTAVGRVNADSVAANAGSGAGADYVRLASDGGLGIRLGSSSVLSWGPDAPISGADDIKLSRNAAGILNLRGSSSTTPGAFNFYTYGASPPSAPGASMALLYADTSGAKIRIMALFPSGAAQQIAIEP